MKPYEFKIKEAISVEKCTQPIILNIKKNFNLNRILCYTFISHRIIFSLIFLIVVFYKYSDQIVKTQCPKIIIMLKHNY